MRFTFLFIFLIFLTNCSSTKDFQYLKKKYKKNKNSEFSKILELKNDVIKMSFEDYKKYLDDYTKKNKYPSLNK